MNTLQKKRAKKERVVTAYGILLIGFACVYLLFPHALTNAYLSVTPGVILDLTFPMSQDIVARHKDIVKYREAFFVIGVGVLVLFYRKGIANFARKEDGGSRN